MVARGSRWCRSREFGLSWVRLPGMPRVLLRHIPALDRILFDGVARSRTPGLDWLMPRLTRLGDNSRLWLAVGLALAAVGGRRGKRAAARGVGAIAATSLLVNQGVKRVVRRPRPSLRLVPSVRRLPTQPLTTSFPSGHAASAAAFTAGVGTDLPKREGGEGGPGRRRGGRVAPRAGRVEH